MLTATAAVAVATGVGLVMVSSTGDDPGPVVLVSGRDDHGILASRTVAVRDAPDGVVIGEVADDVLVEVHDTRSTWLEVSTLEGPELTGWIDDFHLRGQLHVVHPDAPACPVRTGDGELEPSALVRVLEVHGSRDDRVVAVAHVGAEGHHHVPRQWVRELPGPRSEPGTACEDTEDLLPPDHDH